MKFSFYDLLGVDQDATPQQIKTAYRAAMKKFHSDVGGSAAQSSLFNEAYRVLSNPRERRSYDADLSGAGHRGASHRGTDVNDRTEQANGAREQAEPEPWGTDEEWGSDESWDRDGSRVGDASGSATPGSGEDASPQTDSGADSGAGSCDPGARPCWITPDVTAAPIRVAPAFDQGRKDYLLALTAWCVLAAVTVLLYLPPDGVGILAVIAVPVSGLAALPPNWVRRFGGWLLGVGWAAAGGVALLGTSCLGEVRGWCAITSAVGLLGVAWLAWRRGKIMSLNRMVGPKAALEFNRWGDPGESGDAVGRFAARATERALRPLYDVPGVKVLHGPPWPGRPDLVIDHAVVCGANVALISSEAWHPGTYSLDEFGVLLLDGAHYPGAEQYFAHAVAAWRRRLPWANIVGFVAPHSVERRGGVRLRIPPGEHVSFVTPDQLADRVGQHLVSQAGIVNRYVLAELLGP